MESFRKISLKLPNFQVKYLKNDWNGKIWEGTIKKINIFSFKYVIFYQINGY